MSEPKKPFPDPLVRDRLFPEAAQIFEFAPVGLAEALTDGIVAVDTNVLLVPYTTGQASLEQIRRTYERLTTEGRLRIPGQVAREFAENRAEKLKIIFQQLSRKRDTTLFARSEYPLLEGIPAYAEMAKREGEISEALSHYRKLIADLLDVIEAWHWDDPVSQMYRILFASSSVVDPQIDREELLTQLKYRQEHRVPPGYKDAQNEHSGVGDLLTWKTLLSIGEAEKRHLIFVSGDEKSDWRYQSEGKALYPRFELLDEYRRASAGKSLLIVSFAELLQQFGAPAPVVAEVKQEEVVSSLSRPSPKMPSYLGEKVERAVVAWLSARYPNSQVEWGQRRSPDIILRTGNLAEGYEVKYISEPRSLVRRMREMVQSIGETSRSLQIPINLVLVAPLHVWGSISIRLAAIRPDIKRLIYSGPKIVVGVFNQRGQFEDRYTFGSGELPPN